MFMTQYTLAFTPSASSSQLLRLIQQFNRDELHGQLEKRKRRLKTARTRNADKQLRDERFVR